jgi:hypothetical protein
MPRVCMGTQTSLYVRGVQSVKNEMVVQCGWCTHGCVRAVRPINIGIGSNVIRPTRISCVRPCVGVMSAAHMRSPQKFHVSKFFRISRFYVVSKKSIPLECRTDILGTVKIIMRAKWGTNVSAAHMRRFFRIMPLFTNIRCDTSWGGSSAGGLRYIWRRM